MGDVFVSLNDKKDSEKVLEEFVDKRYLGRKIKIVCIPVESYNGYFKKLFEKWIIEKFIIKHFLLWFYNICN